MLVDENEINRFLTHKMLKMSGFSGGILHFENTDEAISYMRDSLPDMLVIDFFQHEQEKFKILDAVEELDLSQKVSTVVLWDFDEDFVKNLSVLYRIEGYYHKPLEVKVAEEIVTLI